MDETEQNRMIEDGKHKSVEVLLATFNGDQFLSELLDSLIDQSFQDFTVLISDDGSTDKTIDILNNYQARYSDKLQILSPTLSQSGASANFGRLLNQATADYVFFCDQDDVWQPDKMEKSLAKIVELETQHGSSMPLLVHSDLAVVDSELNLINNSLFQYSNIDPNQNDLIPLLWQNTVTGCTALVNRALYKQASPIPDGITMYDHWLALVATSIGKIACLPDSTILYRQHGSNVFGANHAEEKASLYRRVLRPFFGKWAIEMLGKQVNMATLVLARYGKYLNKRDYDQAHALAKFWDVPRYSRFVHLWRIRTLKRSFLENIALFVVTARKKPVNQRSS